MGWMRKAGIWPVAQRIHSLVSPPICAFIHRVVVTLGRYLPVDLVLKHHYDYVTIYVDPKLITGFIKANAGMMTEGGIPIHGVERLRKKRELGGAWKSASRHISRSFVGRFIADGDWDREVKPFEILPSMVQMFAENAKPEETTEYQYYLTRIQEKDFKWTRGLRSLQEIDAYFAATKKLFDDIRIDGYRTQSELGNDGSDEIRVCIDRKGHMNVFGGGTHRLSIALLLEVPAVPVLIKRVHAGWVSDCIQRFGGTPQAAINSAILDFEAQKEC